MTGEWPLVHPSCPLQTTSLILARSHPMYGDDGHPPPQLFSMTTTSSYTDRRQRASTRKYTFFIFQFFIIFFLYPSFAR